MTVTKFARAILLIALGVWACWIGRAESAIMAEIGVAGSGLDHRLPALYSDHLTSFELASVSLFVLSSDASPATALGTVMLAYEPAVGAAFALPFSFSGAWATSFSNLNLPPAYWDAGADPRTVPDYRDGMARAPRDFALAQDIDTPQFREWNEPAAGYWDWVSNEASRFEFEVGVTGLPPVFETLRDADVREL